MRRLTQTGFLLFFLYLFIQTVYHPINITSGPITFFFDVDPLILLTTWLANLDIPGTLLLSLVTLGVTFLAGRWFCGWFCPLGSLHNLFTSLRAEKYKTGIRQEEYSPWQKSKYYTLIAFLLAALLGANVVGWLDPFSLLFRSITIAVFPIFHYGVKGFFGWIYFSNPTVGGYHLTALTEPIYELFRQYILLNEQPYFHQGLPIGLLFLLILLLNLVRNRFWCRYICPLGALLGLTGKNPLIRLHTNPGTCTNCRLCVPTCQGGANPHGESSWKPSECLFCLNCHAVCPSRSIRITWNNRQEKARG